MGKVAFLRTARFPLMRRFTDSTSVVLFSRQNFVLDPECRLEAADTLVSEDHKWLHNADGGGV